MPGAEAESLERARALQIAGDLEGAERLYRALLERCPEHAPAMHLLGLVELQRERPRAAAALLGQAIAIDGADPTWHLNHAVALLGDGRAGEAVASYREAGRLAPRWAPAHNGLGVALQEAGDAPGAAAAFERAFALDPASADAAVNLASMHQEEGRPEAAIAWFERALALEPQVADLHRELGNVLLAAGRFDEAVSSCERAVSLDPDDAAGHYALGYAHDEQGRLQDAAAHYRRAIEIDPGHIDALANLATILRQSGRIDESIECLRRASAVRPGDPDLERSLRAALARQLPPWHFRMLADEHRNDAYRQAIERAVGPSDVVLDIGTGSGLLAMMAARAGARAVVGCELSPPVAEAARAVIAANGLEGHIEIIERRSTALAVGEHLPEHATVLVSEIVDVGLLGEGVLPTVRHALAHLVTPGARIIPAAATVHACLVEVPDLRRVNPLRHLSGFDLSAFDRFRVPGEYLDLDLEKVAHRRLSEAFEVESFDLAAPPARVPDTAPRRTTLEAVATASGTVHGIAMWFDLQLDDELTISTRPGSDIAAWGQAVQFFERDTAVREGERLALTVLVSDTRIEFQEPDPASARPGGGEPGA